MFASKKGFTLVEVIIVIVMITAMFSMAIPILGSFSKRDYTEKEFDEMRSFLSQVKYLKILNEKNINIACSGNKILISLGGNVMDEKGLKNFKCRDKNDSTISLNNGSTTLEFNINQYGYVSIQRI